MNDKISIEFSIQEWENILNEIDLGIETSEDWCDSDEEFEKLYSLREIKKVIQENLE